MKGSIIISETILEAAGVLISFILIALVVNMVFSQQTVNTYESAFQSMARDTSIAIDRVAASSGSMYIQQNLTKGLRFNLFIDYKSIIIKYSDKAVQNYFIADTRSGPYIFSNPKTLCIAKGVNDNRIMITNDTCVCNAKDEVCDPACVVKNICDQKCMNDASGACNPLCSSLYPATCDRNCYTNEYSGVCEKSCIKDGEADSICSPDCNNVKKGVCDTDCYNIYSNGKTGFCDPDCPAESKVTTVENVKTKIPDGKCYSGCANYTRKDGILVLKYDGICDADCNIEISAICDPDCKNSEPCKTRCTKEGERAEKYSCCNGLVACPGTDICVKDKPLACCGNGICEGRPDTANGWGPGNKTQWETAYNCVDCGSSSRPSCSAGSFASSPCFTNTDQTDCTLHDPHWTPNVIHVCSEEVLKFLDRRNWNLKEVAKTIVSAVPEGWAFDYSRYSSILSPAGLCGGAGNMCYVQASEKTIAANENYKKEFGGCCAYSGCCAGDASYVGSDCNGVGFCGDHAVGVLSIFRAAGVPAKDVYATFTSSSGYRHAFVVYKCDASLPDSLKLDECNGHWGEWLRVDATSHSITLLRGSAECGTMCVWYNDAGAYPTISVKDGGGNMGTVGYPFPTETGCKVSPCCVLNKLCPQIGVECIT